jgi:gliding motility-associated-like protein
MKKIKIVTLFVLLCTGIYSNAKNSMCKTSAGTNPQDSLSITAPNVFTPNGDGVNDTWSIIVHGFGVTVFGLETTVYDRWGKQIFQTTNIREVWSGHNSIGEQCSNGTYFYVINYTNGFTGEQKVLKGFVELLR